MDNSILKKRLNTFKTDKGRLKKVSNDVIMEVLRTWENWPRSAAELYRELGLSKMQLVIILKNAKKLVSSGAVIEDNFNEVKMENLPSHEPNGAKMGAGIEIIWDAHKIIRFSHVDQVIEFLKKVA